jgi:uncharacterized protein YbjT (DUF2867 family)
MTVMVTGASGPVGHALVPLLRDRDEVRAAVRRPESAEVLRSLGAKVTIGRLDQADALAEVLGGVFTLIHLVGGPNQPDEEELWNANHGSVIRAVSAAREAGVRRFILVSVPGACPESDEPYLRARGLAEEAVRTSGLDHAVIRCTHAYAVGGLWFTAVVEGALQGPPIVVGDGRQPIAPVAVDDLAASIAAADDRHGPLAGTWALEGPTALTADELARLLAGEGGPEPVHLAGADAQAALERLLGLPVSAEAVRAFEAPSRADAPDAAEAFEIRLTPLVAGIRRTLERAAALSGSDAG